MRRSPSFTPLLAVCALLTPLAACVSADDKPAHNSPQRPADSKLTTMWLATTLPQDTDGNGYVDLFDISMYLFAEPYPIPVQQPGSLNFKLVNVQGKTLCEWNLDPAAVAAGSATLPAGPGYLFRLNLLDHASDTLPRQQAEILGTFTSPDGSVIRQRSSTFKVGRTGL
jgi:hypothetical protein